jgi:hypothetical protein
MDQTSIGLLALMLFGLPASLVLAFQASRQRRANPAPAAAPAQSSPPALPPPWRLAILETAVRVPHACSAEELAAAIAGRRARASLDPELTDDDGFPVMSARCAGAADGAVRDEVDAWLADLGEPGPGFADEAWRALALACSVAGELAALAASERIAAPGALPRLDLVSLLPSDWTAAQRMLARRWLRRRIVHCGWPAERVALADEGDAQAPLARFGQVARVLDGSDAGRLALIVACDSAIGTATLERWAAQGALFSASHMQGVMPGEGAVALLVSSVRYAQACGTAAPVVLAALEEGRRPAPLDEEARPDPALLGELTGRALAHGGIAASGVGLLVADTGHRTSRVLELMAHAAASLPQLDSSRDLVRAGLACGACGELPFLAALALGWHYALERGRPVLCVSNEDPSRRVVALVRKDVGTASARPAKAKNLSQ